MNNDRKVPTENRDPISGATGAHPVGTGVGAVAGGAAAGAAVGTVAGPVGTAVGAAVGAVVGGLVGKGVAEGIDPTVEDTYWRSNYASRPYVTAGKSYDHYQPAYKYGWEARARHGSASWDQSQDALRKQWSEHPGFASVGMDCGIPGYPRCLGSWHPDRASLQGEHVRFALIHRSHTQRPAYAGLFFADASVRQNAIRAFSRCTLRKSHMRVHPFELAVSYWRRSMC